MVVGNNHGSIYIYETKAEDKKSNKTEAHKKQIRDISFTADSRKVVTVSDDYTIGIFDVEKFSKYAELSGHKGIINSVDCHPKDKSRIVTASYDRTVKIWDIEKKTCLETINMPENVLCVRYSHDGELIGAGK